MKFAIGNKRTFQNAGFLTEGWRHSADGELVLVHSEFAETLIDLAARQDIQVYDHKDDAFQEALNNLFSERREVGVEEGSEIDLAD